MRSLQVCGIVSVSLAIVGTARAQTPLGTGFTYQGQLKQSGAGLTGTADFQFSLWDGAGSGSPPTGGTQLGSTQTVSDVSVSAGLFTVQLNAMGEFSGSAFSGDARWLQIAVRFPAGNGSYTPLSPRQALTAAPYALFALSSPGSGEGFWAAGGNDIHNTNSGNVGIGTETPTYPLHVVSDTTPAGGVILGKASASSGSGIGVVGETWSNLGGSGVYGAAYGTSGQTHGVSGLSGSSNGKGVFAYAAASSGPTYGVYAQTVSPNGTGVFGWASTGTDGTSYGVHGRADSCYGVGIKGESTHTGNLSTYGVYGTSASIAGTGVYGHATANSGTTYGVYGRNNSNEGAGVYGWATGTSGAAVGVRGRSSSDSGTGVYGEVTAANSLTYGVYGTSISSTGRGVEGYASAANGTSFGGRFQSDSAEGTGVYGRHSAVSGTGAGVHGTTSSVSPNAVGVLGEVTPTSPGSFSSAVRGINNGAGSTGIGVWGSQAGWGWGGHFTSVAGRGVYAQATATTGETYGVYGQSDSTSGRGVYGRASATTGTNYGVYGESASASGYGVYFVNRLAGTGTKSFQMDHPLDPENKYLNHFCTEGPEPYNVYRGNVVTDRSGFAAIKLPDYFDSINRDPSYHLTVIDNSDEFVLAKVVREIENNQFVIRTSKPSVKVSWRVDAVRNDLWVQAYGFTTERDKPAGHKGKYLSPELYGQPREKGMNYHEEPGASPAAPSEATED